MKIIDLEQEIKEIENELKIVDEIELLNPKDPINQGAKPDKNRKIHYIG